MLDNNLCNLSVRKSLKFNNGSDFFDKKNKFTEKRILEPCTKIIRLSAVDFNRI